MAKSAAERVADVGAAAATAVAKPYRHSERVSTGCSWQISDLEITAANRCGRQLPSTFDLRSSQDCLGERRPLDI